MMSSGESSRTIHFVEILSQRAARYPEKKAFRFLEHGEREAESLTYAELDRRARAIAALLGKTHEPGARLLLILPHGPDFIAAFFGCLYAGLIAVPAYPPRANQHGDRLAAIVRDAEAGSVLTTPDLIEPVRDRFPPDLAGSLAWLSTDVDAAAVDAAAVGPTQAKVAEFWSPDRIHADTPAFLQYTSGSTGRPKGVVVTHGNLVANAAAIAGPHPTPSETGRVVSWLPMFHDMGLVFGVLYPIYRGWPCWLMNPVDFLRNPVRWLRAISRFGGTHAAGPDFAYNLCARRVTDREKSDLDLSRWRVAYDGAEPVRGQTLARFFAEFAAVGFRREAFCPAYGMAESTLKISAVPEGKPPRTFWADQDALALGRVLANEPDQERTLSMIGCGPPAPDTEIAIIAPDCRKACPADVVGEIWVRGPSVGAGYWRRPEETAHSFGAFRADTGEGPYLRTGDLGFIDGSDLFITGRIKDLIIIRGRNIYPSDIESAAEQAHPALYGMPGAAFSVESEGEERLVLVQEIARAYLGKLGSGEVLAAIRARIADDDQISVHAVALVKPASLPKTSSGKVRRGACRTRFLESGFDTVAAQSYYDASAGQGPSIDLAELATASPDRQNAMLTAYFRTLIHGETGIRPTREDPSLAGFGLDSLQAMTLQHRSERDLGFLWPGPVFLEDPRLSELVRMAWSRLTDEDEKSPASFYASSGRDFPLSYNQRALWHYARLNPESSAYNLPFAATIRGAARIDVLERALRKTVRRHPALRTTFRVKNGAPIQKVHRRFELDFAVIDAPRLTGSGLVAAMATIARQPFDLEKGPLLKARIFLLQPGYCALLVVVHHLVIDFRAFSVVLSEWSHFYGAEIAGREPAPLPIAGTYEAFSDHQARESAQAAKDPRFWRSRLTIPSPVLALSGDRPRAAHVTDRGELHGFTLAADLAQVLKRLALDSETTLYTVLAAAFQLWLYRITGQNDISVGTPVAGRSHAAFAETVGYMVNPVVVRTDFEQDGLAGLAFDAFLARFRSLLGRCLRHGDYPYQALVEGLGVNGSPTPFFQAMFVFQQPDRLTELGAFSLGRTGAKMRWADLELASLPVAQRNGHFDLTLVLAETETGLAGSFVYATDLFDAGSVRRMADQFTVLLDAIAADAALPIRTYPLMSDEERSETLHLLQNHDAAPEADRCLHELFEDQVLRTPEATAIWVDAQGPEHARHWSYALLNQEANRLAFGLRERGVGPEIAVAVRAPRGFELIVGLLAAIKAGGAYVPLDPGWPTARTEYVLTDLATPVLLSHHACHPERFSFTGDVLFLDEPWRSGLASNPGPAATPANTVNIIFTSGSTGRPKGVLVPHRELVHYLTRGMALLAVSDGEGSVLHGSMSFDAVGSYLWPPLLAGKPLLLLPEEEETAHLAELLRGARRFGYVKTSATQLRRMETEYGLTPRKLKTRWLTIGGEAFGPELFRPWIKASPDTRFLNEYGPTETTIATGRHRVGEEYADPVPMGRPIPARVGLFWIARWNRFRLERRANSLSAVADSPAAIILCPI